MPINESEWASILAAAEKVARQVSAKRGDFITATVVKRNTDDRLVWVAELGSQPIPVVAHSPSMKYYDEVIQSIAVNISGITASPSLTATSTPTVTNRAPTRQIFTSGSGTYNRPANVIAIIAECLGGGGGGGGAPATNSTSATAGGGGGGAAFASKLILSPAASYSYVVGAGGSGVAGANGNPGTASNFGSGLCIAAGGLQGSQSSTTVANLCGSPGGTNTGSVGDFILVGSSGDYGLVVAPASCVKGGYGGAAARGGGSCVGTGLNGAGSNGSVGIGPGGGGGGAANCVSQATARAGGNGADGLIVVQEFYSIDVAVATAIAGGITIGGSATATPTTKVNVKHSSGDQSTPDVGDTVLIALEMGELGLPRCLGVIQGRNWQQVEDESV